MHEKELSVAINAAHAAGKLTMEHYDDPKAMIKPDKTEVTNADIECEKIIKEIIKKSFPTHSFLGEETGMEKSSSQFLWVVDPIDGTTNYIMKNPFFSTSICLAVGNEPVLGVAYNPFTKELFTAVSGSGAMMNGKKLATSKTKDITSAVIGFCYTPKTTEKASELFSAITKRCNKFRQFGSAALELSYVAAGRIDAFFMISANAWDIAAGALIARESGAVVTDFSGAPWNLSSRDILSSNYALSNQLLEIIKNSNK